MMPMCDLPEPAWADIDLTALDANIRRIVQQVSPARLMIVLKSGAYGHGMLPVAAHAYAAGIRFFGSLTIADGLTLRADALPEDARIFAWLHTPDDRFAEAAAAGIEFGISTTAELDTIVAATAVSSEPARVHLKIDTGLRRNGASAADWPDLVEHAAGLQRTGLVRVEGIWSHLAEASDDADTTALREFDAAVEVAKSRGVTPPLKHIAASCAGLIRPDARYDLVRMGAFPLGIAPGGGVSPRELELVPVMTLMARIVEVTEADGIRRARLPIGISDGMSSAYAGTVSVSVGGARCTVLSVGLSETDIDVGDAIVNVGDVCIFFGPGAHGEATLQEWADAVGTIGEEIVVRLSPHLPRHYHG